MAEMIGRHPSRSLWSNQTSMPAAVRASQTCFAAFASCDAWLRNTALEGSVSKVLSYRSTALAPLATHHSFTAGVHGCPIASAKPRSAIQAGLNSLD